MRYAKVTYCTPEWKVDTLLVPVKDHGDFQKLCKEWGFAYKEKSCIMMPYVSHQNEGYTDVVGTIAMKADDIYWMKYVDEEPKLLVHDADGNVIGEVVKDDGTE